MDWCLVCTFFSLLCRKKAAKSVAQTIQNQRVGKMGNHIILSANDNKSARINVDQSYHNPHGKTTD